MINGHTQIDTVDGSIEIEREIEMEIDRD